MGVDALLEELLEGKDAIADRVVTRVRAEMPNFEAVPLEEHKAGIATAVELIVRARLEDPAPSFGGGTTLLREIGERRARQGIPVDDLLRSWRLGIEETMSYARDIAPGSGAEPDELFDLFQQAFGLADAGDDLHRRRPPAGADAGGSRAGAPRCARPRRASRRALDGGAALRVLGDRARPARLLLRVPRPRRRLRRHGGARPRPWRSTRRTPIASASSPRSRARSPGSASRRRRGEPSR